MRFKIIANQLISELLFQFWLFQGNIPVCQSAVMLAHFVNGKMYKSLNLDSSTKVEKRRVDITNWLSEYLSIITSSWRWNLPKSLLLISSRPSSKIWHLPADKSLWTWAAEKVISKRCTESTIKLKRSLFSAPNSRSVINIGKMPLSEYFLMDVRNRWLHHHWFANATHANQQNITRMFQPIRPKSHY